MRRVKCVDPQGKITIIDGKAKAAKHLTAATGYPWSEYYVQQAADTAKDIVGFQLSWATPEEIQQHARSAVAEAGEESSREDDMQQDGAMDRLADGIRSFGIGVVFMDRHDTPVPYGYFYATKMLEQAGKQPANYVSCRSTIDMAELLSKQLCLTYAKVIPTFKSGLYKGTWVHRQLGTNLAMYCDRTGALKLAVSQVICALADRTPVPAPAPAPPPSLVPAVPLGDQEKALGILHVAAAEDKALAVQDKALAVQERKLKLAKQFSELERSHLKEISSIEIDYTERQAAVKRKQQADSEQHASKQARRAADAQALKEKAARKKAETQAAKDRQDQLRTQAHRNDASNLRTGLTSMSGTFVMDTAVHKAAKDMGVAYHLVVKFMKLLRISNLLLRISNLLLRISNLLLAVRVIYVWSCMKDASPA